ncbi:helix-turn-helix domain-containing protein [Actinophytocola oryzae]|uniref:AraC family transcriptional regulator n=1 Tax=Actinophytocola oryzae TaxID=502181 RepID=A0A4R7UY69_9PSEU|nr:AraC family transcriptional regulator [Actinophytocola oryzae]TDV41077.1 AraC family transcriptional regulator [Actinophytocola oryzae]
MDDAIEAAVERVIRAMRENLGEQITMDDMARAAMFSKFHFSRIFLRVTGISPGRFLSALRLQEAKRLLLTTSMPVADISHVVGYNSIGTFSSRFRFSVGVSPSEYRQYDGLVPPLTTPVPDAVERPGVVSGHVWSTPGHQPGRVVIGLFPGRIAQGAPVGHVTREGIGPFEIGDVPTGSWHVLAHAVETGHDDEAGPMCVAAFGPVEIAPNGAAGRGFDMWLRSPRIFDPPALLAQLDERVLAAAATRTWVPGRVDESTLSGA